MNGNSAGSTGRPFDAEVSLNRVFVGQEIYLQMIIRDITERRRMEEATRESERRYRILFETAQEAILVIKGMIFVDCNPGAERLLGCSRQEILGGTPFRFSPELQPDGQRSEEKGTELVKKCIRQGPQRFEWVHQALDGRRFDVEVSLSQFYIEGQSHLFVMERDITEQKRAQEELRALSLIDDLTGLVQPPGFSDPGPPATENGRTHAPGSVSPFCRSGRFERHQRHPGTFDRATRH